MKSDRRRHPPRLLAADPQISLETMDPRLMFAGDDGGWL